MNNPNKLTPRGQLLRMILMFFIAIIFGMSLSGAVFTRMDAIPPGHEQDTRD